jgi:hypothetical protein
VDYPGYAGFYYTEITIYNFNTPTLMRVIEEGSHVYLDAGYQDGNFGEIFSGFIFQSLLERENVTDYKLTLRCIDGAGIFDDNFISTAMTEGHTQTTQFNAIMAYSQTPIAQGKTPVLADKRYPRGMVIHSTPDEAIRSTLKFKNTMEPSERQWFGMNGKLEVVDATDESSGDMIVVSPTTGLVGTPVQTQYGADFQVLLNPSIRLSNPRVMVKIDNSSFKQARITSGVVQSVLDQDQEFQVVGVRHVGDTRGDDWYTYVTGINKAGMQPVGLEERVQGTLSRPTMGTGVNGPQ